MRILLVEDAEDLALATRAGLARAGMACDLAATVAEADAFLRVQAYDAVALDIDLPDGSGTELLRAMRQRGQSTPVLMLTAAFSVDDKLSAFNLGADDYLVKPFDQRELEARLHAMHRRTQAETGPEVTLGRLCYNAGRATVTVDGNRLDLTRREFTLLGLLVHNPGQVFSKERLLERLYSFDEAEVGANAIELYVARLRKKLAGSGVTISTLRGFGYRIDADG